jgi:hypothetical protein
MKDWIKELCPEIAEWQAELIAEEAQKAVRAEREEIIAILSRTEFTSLDHMPSEAALIIRLRGGP